MAALTSAMLAAGALGVGGGIIGRIASAGDRAKAEQAMKDAYAQITAIGAPPDLSAEIVREKLKQVGVYDPKMEDSIQQDISQFSKIQEDPKLRDAQAKSLQLLQQRGEAGLTPAERSAFNENRRKVAQEAQGQRQQILQSMAARGMGGGGAELAAQLSASQSGDERLSSEGDRLAALASQNALQSTAQAGQLGGQIRGQDFSVASAKAQAADELNRFNTQAQIARQQRNVSSQNQAQLANLAEQQRVSDYNTQMTNAERDRQAQARQQYWNSQLGLAQAKSGALLGQGQQYGQQAQNTAGMWQGIGSGLGGAVSAGAAGEQQNALLTTLANKGNQNNQPDFSAASYGSKLAQVPMPEAKFGDSMNRRKNWWEQ